MSSTIAIAYGRREAWHNLVRAGHAIYGYVSPARGGAPKPILQVRPALTWRARSCRVKDIPEGALIGYGGTFRAPRAMRVAVIGAGYADGIFHRLSNRGKVIAAGKLTPILGTVSMDLTTIDMSHAPWLAPGDEVTLLGRKARPRWTRSRWPRWPAPSPITSCAVSAPACAACTYSAAAQQWPAKKQRPKVDHPPVRRRPRQDAREGQRPRRISRFVHVRL